jgi:hypothetical protein
MLLMNGPLSQANFGPCQKWEKGLKILWKLYNKNIMNINFRPSRQPKKKCTQHSHTYKEET